MAFGFPLVSSCMTVTVARASFISSSGCRYRGSVSWEKSSPGTLRACIFADPSASRPGPAAWSAYRTRRDSEGQRQLESAMAKAARSLSLAPEDFVRTDFSAREPSLPSPFSY